MLPTTTCPSEPSRSIRSAPPSAPSIEFPELGAIDPREHAHFRKRSISRPFPYTSIPQSSSRSVPLPGGLCARPHVTSKSRPRPPLLYRHLHTPFQTPTTRD